MLEKAKKDKETRKWIYEQTHGTGPARVQAFQAHDGNVPYSQEEFEVEWDGEKADVDVRTWEDNVKYGFGYGGYGGGYGGGYAGHGGVHGQSAWEIHEQAERWMREEDTKRKERARREAERAERVREEMRRIEERVQRKVEDAKRQILEQRQVRIDSRERRDRERAERAWKSYEGRWQAILSSSAPSASTSSLTSNGDEDLHFSNIPWPTFTKPKSPAGLTGLEIASFFLCPHHSVGVSNKDRIRAGLRLYHPDRFRKIAPRVTKEEKAIVDEGVGIVARVLNDLLAREASRI